MSEVTFRKILYFICAVIVITACTQFYWNYKNYTDGKEQLVREVQSSVDNAIDSYFIDRAERNSVGFSLSSDGKIIENPGVDSVLTRMGKSDLEKSADFLETIDPSNISKMEVLSGYKAYKQDSFSTIGITSDSADEERNLQLAKRIIISFKTDTLDMSVLNRYISDQLNAKNINADYSFSFQHNGYEQQYNTALLHEERLQTTSHSGYLPKGSSFDFYFTNITSTLLLRNSLGILLSLILTATVVGCLFFLLKIINQQKQLAELKNDLISNITHEFQTPISTAKVALEGIENFNHHNDPVKTRNYLQVTNIQLNKLQLMVEKLLETSTLEGNNVQLNREDVMVVPMLSELVEKYRPLAQNRNLQFSAKGKNISVLADPFHLENALNNILDNAVKYGGQTIEVAISEGNDIVRIQIRDSGTSLTPEQADQVFDKFYRVPKGNRHDVKGFGIGLYYTKQIIEKHGGSIRLHRNNQTSFIITLPKNG